MKQYKKLLAVFAAAIMLAICFAGCSSGSTTAARDTVYNSSSQYAPMEEYAPAPAATSPVSRLPALLPTRGILGARIHTFCMKSR